MYISFLFSNTEDEVISLKTNFFRCGMYGWCLEILWTGLHSLTNHDRKLTGVSSLHMFPIYGMAAFFRPLASRLSKYGTVTRGCVYMCCIYAIEYLSGTYLKKRDCCPWDYSSSRYHINGVIRLDYAPLWFLTGLFYEKAIVPKQQG